MRKRTLVIISIVLTLAFILGPAAQALAHNPYAPPKIGKKYPLDTIEKTQPELRTTLGEDWWAANKNRYALDWFGLYTTSAIRNKYFPGGYQFVGIDKPYITTKAKKGLKKPVLVVTAVDEYSWPIAATIYKPKGWQDSRIFATIRVEDVEEPWMP